MSLRTETEAFFAAYVAAFKDVDASAIADLWEPVGLFPSPTGNFAVERDALRDHCERLLDFYRKQGVVTPSGALLSVEELFPNVAQARMAYRMLGHNDHVVAHWEHVYILRKDARWRISLTIADGEVAAWSALGAM